MLGRGRSPARVPFVELPLGDVSGLGDRGGLGLGDEQASVTVALSLWWFYFDIGSRAAEDRLRAATGQARTRMALEAYSYGHFPIVAGIIVTALGVEKPSPTPPRRRPSAASTPLLYSAVSRSISPVT